MSDNQLPAGQSNPTRTQFYKILVIGDGSVGKTCLWERLCYGTYMENRPMSTAPEYEPVKMKLDGTKNIFLLSTIPGQQRFRTIVEDFLKDSNAIIGVFDLTDRKTFENLFSFKGWLPKVYEISHSQNMGQNLKMMILGNKYDLCEQGLSTRQVEFGEGAEMASQWDAAYFETSAKNKMNVRPAFTYMFTDVSKSVTSTQLHGIVQEYESTPTLEEMDKNYLISSLEQLENGSYDQVVPRKVANEIKVLGSEYSGSGSMFSLAVDETEVSREELIEHLRWIPDTEFYQVKDIIGYDTYKDILNEVLLPIPGTFSVSRL